MVAQPWQFTQSAVFNSPVRQQALQRWEYVKWRACSWGICWKESRNKHISTVLVYLSQLWIILAAAKVYAISIAHAVRISCISILCLHPVTEPVYRIAECLKRFWLISVVGIAHSLKRTLQTYCCHSECTTLSCWHARIHILYAARLGYGATGIQVYLQVAQRFKRHPYLQVLAGVCCSRCSHTVVIQQPVVFISLLQIAISSKSEGEV